MRTNWTFSLTLALVASTFACSRADDDPDRLTAVSATVQLLSVDSQQVVTPSGLTMKVIATVEPPVVRSTTVQANSFWLDSTIQMGARLALASLGDGGFALMCSQNGTVLATQPAVTMADASTDSTVTNSVAAGPVWCLQPMEQQASSSTN